MTITSIDSRRAAGLAFAGVLALGALALGVTLSGSPLAVARVNGREHVFMGVLRQRVAACQGGEALPRETSAVRLQLFAFTGPRVTVAVFANGRPIAHGERPAGWTGGSVTVPLNPLSRAREGMTVCFSVFLNGDEGVSVNGEPTNAARAAQARGGPLRGRVRVEDLRAASSSWWSLLAPVARRMGLGHAASGTWSALLVLGLMLGVGQISWRVVRREFA